MIWTIYLIQNKLNGKAYIGQTRRGSGARWKQHLRDCRRSSFHFYNAIRKYGPGLFDVHDIAYAGTQLEANELERRWISAFTSTSREYGYNVASGGQFPLGDVSGETRQKQRKAKLSKPCRYWLGKKRDPATVKLMAANRMRADIPTDECLRLYLGGLSCREIAARYNTTCSTISWRLRNKTDVVMRPTGGFRKRHKAVDYS